MTPKSRHHLVIASGVRGDTCRYRTHHLFEQCLLAGIPATLSHAMDRHFIDKLKNADALVLHRAAWDDNIQRAVDIIHDRGGKVIYDTDDLLFDPNAFQWIDSPDFADPVRASLYQEDMRRHQRTIKICDAVMTSTQYLAEQTRSFGLETYNHRNAFSCGIFDQSSQALQKIRPESGEIIIGYASGTPTHNTDFEVSGLALRKIMDEYKHVTLCLVGPVKLGVVWKEYTARILRLPLVPWRKLPSYLSRFDINLAPLVIDNPFAQSKSEIKWMEAALVKVPTIASGTSAFKMAIHSGETGLLASSNTEWQDALGRLVEDKELRQAIGNAAHEEVLTQYSPLMRAEEFHKTLLRVTNWDFQPLETNRERIDRSNIKRACSSLDGSEISRYERIPSLLRMAGYSLRYRGVTTLAKQGWVYFRRLVSPVLPYQKNKESR
jgi:O-antigen biosynthesis protein